MDETACAGVDLEEIFRRYERMVFVYFLRMVRTRADAEDLTQETFVRACAAAIRFRGEAAVSTWLLGIARRVLYEAARSGLFDQTEALPEAAPSEDMDKRIDLDLALRLLSPPDREAILLVDVLGFSPMEAATIANASREAFRVRLHRARKRFQEVYSR